MTTAMKKFLIIAGLSMAGMSGVHLRGIWQAVQDRAELAQSWSSDSAQFAAVGTFNQTLYIALPENDPVTTDVLVDSILADHKLVEQLRGEGFNAIQSGARTGRLR
jgi:hypothetical protein